MSQLILQKIDEPEAPLVNKISIYAKSDGNVYAKDENGIEMLLSNSEVSLLEHIAEANPHPQYLLKTNARKVQYVTIDSLHLTNKKIILDKVPINPQYVQADLKEGGGPLFFGEDFIVVGNELSWDGLELEAIIGFDDKIRIIYDHY